MFASFTFLFCFLTHLNFVNSSLATVRRLNNLSVRSNALSNRVLRERPFFSKVEISSLERTSLPVKTTCLTWSKQDDMERVCASKSSFICCNIESKSSDINVKNRNRGNRKGKSMKWISKV